MYRRAGAVAYGAGIALGMIEAPEEYYLALTSGRSEALAMKARMEMAHMSSRNGSK